MTRTLDQLLAAWADDVRLRDDEADAMARAIVAEPRPQLPADWWQHLQSQVTAAVLQATDTGRFTSPGPFLPQAA
jgi:hypothetical protein